MNPSDVFHGVTLFPARYPVLRTAAFLTALSLSPLTAADNEPPAGFVALFNGRDFSNWKLPEGDNGHWKIKEGVIDYDALSEATGDKHLWTEREFGDFVLHVDWRIKETPYVNPNVPYILPDGTHARDVSGKEMKLALPDSDSGIFLRGSGRHQINIWCWPIGSGEMYSVRMDRATPPAVRAAVTPRMQADKPVGEWNHFEITVRGRTVTVDLNGQKVIPGAEVADLPARGRIALQHHGGKRDGKWNSPPSLVQFKNIFVKELPSTAAPASATDLFQAIRNGDLGAVRAALAGRAPVDTQDELGNTPLMAAALYADAPVLELLLAAGAGVNASNKEGATALMRAATFGDKARLLVASGADVKARSALGNTALIMAARQHGNARTVGLLLDRGADVNAANVFGATAVMAAVAAEDADTVQLLLDRGADVNAKPATDGGGFIWGGGRTALMWAAFKGNENLTKLLLARGAKVNEFSLVGGALAQAAWAGRTEVARVLLEAGAQVDQRDLIANFTPLHWAASSERLDPGLVKLLLAHRADANAEGGEPVDGFLGVGQTPLMLARKRGETPIVEALVKAGARPVVPPPARPAPKPMRAAADSFDAAATAAALQSAIPTLQKTAADSYGTFRRHATRQDCISCHQQQIPMGAIGLAHSRQIVTDRDAARRQLEQVIRDITLGCERDLQVTFHPEPAIGDGYSLLGLRLENQPASTATDGSVHHLAVIQHPDGHWAWNLPRPPIQSSDIGATALAVHALRFYAIPARQREFDERIQRARTWLGAARPESNEERAYQLLGLAWADEPSARLTMVAEELIREQRSDGGWGQLAGLPSDAFATGQSLYALIQGAALPSGHPAVRRGLGFLLRTQLDDGTWHVRRRAFPFQPPMDSGFSHGADGWISSAATSWAVMALAAATDPSQPPPVRLAVTKPAAAVRGATTDSAGSTSPPVEFARDIQPLLERSCVTCHSGERARGGFQMVNRASLLQGGKRGEPVIVASHSEQSPLVRFVSDQVEDLEMPPVAKRDKFPALTKRETTLLRAWIDQGAVWPEDVKLRAPGT